MFRNRPHKTCVFSDHVKKLYKLDATSCADQDDFRVRTNDFLTNTDFVFLVKSKHNVVSLTIQNIQNHHPDLLGVSTASQKRHTRYPLTQSSIRVKNSGDQNQLGVRTKKSLIIVYPVNKILKLPYDFHIQKHSKTSSWSLDSKTHRLPPTMMSHIPSFVSWLKQRNTQLRQCEEKRFTRAKC